MHMKIQKNKYQNQEKQTSERDNELIIDIKDLKNILQE